MINRIIKYFYIALITLMVGICLFGAEINYACKKAFELPSFVYVLIGVSVVVVLGAVIAAVSRKKSSFYIHDKICGIDTAIVLSISTVWFILSLIATHFYYFKSGWDVRAVVESATAIASGNIGGINSEYFSIFPNNALVTCLFSLIIKLGYCLGYRNEYYCLIVFQCFSMMTSGVLTFFSVYKLSKRKRVAYLAWFLFLILCGLSPWVVIPYTDTVGLFVISIVLFLYSTEKIPVLLGFFLMTGYYIKPCVLIFGIASAISVIPEITDWVKEKRAKGAGKQIKKLVIRFGLIIAGMVLGFVFVKVCVKLNHIEIDSNKTFNMSQFIMMGLNEESNGVINPEDQSFSLSIENPKERTRENLRVSLERIKEMGFPGLMRHSARKILTSYNDGTFAWGSDGQFFDQMIWTGHPKIEDVFRSFYYPGGNRYNLFLNIMQSIWMGVLVFSIMGGMWGNDKQSNTMMLTLIGALLFELFFEPRARHLLVELPIFFYLASIGFWGGADFLRKKIAGNKSSKEQLNIEDR